MAKKRRRMLLKLQVQNYAIIDRLEIDFSNKLTIITGETGAGKSILLGALSLILGNRANPNVLFDSKRKCVIEGIFNIAQKGLQKFFDKNDLDYEDETIIRREITPSGKSRAFINDTPVNLTLLSQLSAQLINLHAQHQNLYLNNRQYQLNVVDSMAGQLTQVEKFRKSFSTFLADQQALEKLKTENQQLKKELDYILFQIEELEGAELGEEGEQEKIESELKQAENSDGIRQALSECTRLLGHDESPVMENLFLIERNLGKLLEFGPDFKQINTRFKSVLIELNDLNTEMSLQDSTIETNPKRANQLKERLDMILRLQNKHQLHSIKELKDYHEELAVRRDSAQNSEHEIAALAEKCAEQEAKLKTLAKKLSKKRQQTIPKIEKKVNALLEQLGMPNAYLKIAIKADEVLNSNGADQVLFLFATNKGSQAIELKKVASGGELSRLMLSIQSLMADTSKLPSLVFDEIDTGISGEVAIKVGKMLCRLAQSHQLICITHLPQIACIGETHYRVFKDDTPERTVSKVEKLEGEERIIEIGTILSGEPPSHQAKANARELLEMMNA